VFNNYANYEYLLASAQLFLAMLGMGALLSPTDFISQVKQPKGLLIGLGMQWCLVPLIAFTLGLVLPIPTGIALGFILIAAVPSGATGNIIAYFGKGNIALSISLTAITTIAAIVTMPLLLHLLLSNYLPASFQMPTQQIAQDIFIALIIPLAFGMLLKAKSNLSFSESFSRWSVRLSLLLIVLMAVSAQHSGRIDPKAYGVMGVLALVIFCLAIQLCAFTVSSIGRLSSPDGLAIVIKSNYRNISLAVAIKAIIFPAHIDIIDPVADAVFFTVLLYGGISLLMSLIVMAIHRIQSPSWVKGG